MNLFILLQLVIAVDDENGDNEGDLVMAATLVNPESIAFMIRNGSGIISVGMKEEDLTRLMIPMMSPITEIEDISTAAATVTVVKILGFATLENSESEIPCSFGPNFKVVLILFRMPEWV